MLSGIVIAWYPAASAALASGMENAGSVIASA
jgi:hypothetical protein